MRPLEFIANAVERAQAELRKGRMSPSTRAFLEELVNGARRQLAERSTTRSRTHSTHDVAQLLDCDPSTVAKWIDKGKLIAYRTPGGHRRVRHADLEAFAAEHGMPLLGDGQ